MPKPITFFHIGRYRIRSQYDNLIESAFFWHRILSKFIFRALIFSKKSFTKNQKKNSPKKGRLIPISYGSYLESGYSAMLFLSPRSYWTFLGGCTDEQPSIRTTYPFSIKKSVRITVLWPAGNILGEVEGVHLIIRLTIKIWSLSS